MPSAAGEPVHLQVVYWALAFLIVLIGGAWKVKGMRGRLNEAWSDRVDILITGLSEGAVLELRELRSKIDGLLGSEDDVYEWTTADPAALLQSVRKYEKLIRVLGRIRTYFRWLLRLENLVIASLLSLGIGVIVIGSLLANLVHLRHQSLVGVVFLGAGAVLGIACFVMYWVFENKLSGAEILAQSVAE